MFADQFRIAKTNNPVHCSFAKISSHKTYAKFRIAKFTMSSQSQFRNAKFHSQCENFAKPISQCQNQFRNAKFKFAMRKFRNANFGMPKSNSQCENLAMPISQCQYTVHLSQPVRNFALQNSQPTLRISQTHFALRNSLPLRNSISQTISHCQIHPAKFTGLVILCN